MRLGMPGKVDSDPGSDKIAFYNINKPDKLDARSS
jgi:hypothetical protein